MDMKPEGGDFNESMIVDVYEYKTWLQIQIWDFGVYRGMDILANILFIIGQNAINST